MDQAKKRAVDSAWRLASRAIRDAKSNYPGVELALNRHYRLRKIVATPKNAEGDYEGCYRHLRKILQNRILPFKNRIFQQRIKFEMAGTGSFLIGELYKAWDQLSKENIPKQSVSEFVAEVVANPRIQETIIDDEIYCLAQCAEEGVISIRNVLIDNPGNGIEESFFLELLDEAGKLGYECRFDDNMYLEH